MSWYVSARRTLIPNAAPSDVINHGYAWRHVGFFAERELADKLAENYASKGWETRVYETTDRILK